jgi:hypothetical protein
MLDLVSNMSCLFILIQNTISVTDRTNWLQILYLQISMTLVYFNRNGDQTNYNFQLDKYYLHWTNRIVDHKLIKTCLMHYQLTLSYWKHVFLQKTTANLFMPPTFRWVVITGYPQSRALSHAFYALSFLKTFTSILRASWTTVGERWSAGIIVTSINCNM